MHHRSIQPTADGSHTIYVEGMDESYHSSKGAVAESIFVFIERGLLTREPGEVNILEIGMGTGLNVLLTMLNGGQYRINYHTLEPFPLVEEEWKALNYPAKLVCSDTDFEAIHRAEFENPVSLSTQMMLTKYRQKLEDFIPRLHYDVIYFDAFAPSKQSGPWAYDNLVKLFGCMNSGGRLVTYCAQGQFKRNLKQIGFEVQNPFGPLGKRQMTIAVKT